MGSLQPSTEFFDEEDVTESPIESWNRWPAEAELVKDDEALVVRYEEGSVRLSRPVDWRAREIDALELVVTAPAGASGDLGILWGPAGQVFVGERSAWRPIEEGEARYLFDLRNETSWSRRIGRLGIDIPVRAGQDVRLHSIRPVRYAYDRDAIAALAETNWRVGIANNVRNAVVTPAGYPITWSFEEPIEGRLLFAHGVLGLTDPAARLRITFENAKGDQGVLFEAKAGADSWSEHWTDVEIEIGRRKAVRKLIFELVEEGRARGEALRADEFIGLGAWANPRIAASRLGEARPNILLVSLDTLRADRLSLYGYPVETSPRLDAWANENAVVFENVVATAPRTLPSHASILTGLDAVTHGANHHRPLSPSFETLAERLRAAGYTTIATNGGGLMDPKFGLGQGFDEIYYWDGRPRGLTEIEHEKAHAFDVLERYADERFFYFFHTYEIHDPYHARPPYSDHCYAEIDDPEASDYYFGALPRARAEEDELYLYYDLVKWRKNERAKDAVPIEEGDLDLVNCLYDSGIAFTDEHFGTLLDRLEELDLLENTLIVVTSDHGEALGEKGLAKHAHLYDNNLMVPLVLALPEGDAPTGRVAAQVGSVDIVPTILEAVGLERSGALDGRSLLPLVEGAEPTARHEAWSYAAHENRGISLRIENQVKYIYNNTAASPKHGAEALYRLREDPSESKNLASEHPDLVERLRERAREHMVSRSKGFVLVFENATCDRISGSLRLPALETRAKAFDMPAGSFRRSSDSEAAWSLGRGEILELTIEEGAPMRLVIDAEGCDSGPVASKEIEYRLSGLEDPRHLVLGAGGWEERDATPGASAIRIEPRRLTGEATEAVDDPEVLEQLRSLGYIQ